MLGLRRNLEPLARGNGRTSDESFHAYVEAEHQFGGLIVLDIDLHEAHRRAHGPKLVLDEKDSEIRDQFSAITRAGHIVVLDIDDDECGPDRADDCRPGNGAWLSVD